LVNLIDRNGRNNVEGIIDTVKTTTYGIGGFWLSLWDWLPEFVSLLVGIATLVYLVIKIYKELK
tara:strand:- start:9121 stop:9312 length:192 start_codon:yes stop_codon:yes gene_type:complete